MNYNEKKAPVNRSFDVILMALRLHFHDANTDVIPGV